ncbi:aspartate/glutamate racemase, partial [Bacillus stratosphericus]
MKTLGIIGGMSPESTVSYYQIINREANCRLGGNSSADILMHSVN